MASDNAVQLLARVQAQEEHVRESWVRAMEAKIVREELTKCQRMEGVNHYENCKWLSEKYVEMLRENKVKGYKQIDTV
ncbi:hypothetical protein DFH11DRAFT_1723787 [Phellopilus nigrolimitatus]|nr:hypothetical protein DFH11DRAFT_1723787 [Phellopilus nigrolimitatus]